MPDDCNVMPDERVQWAADSENGIVLVPARGHNLVVSFGTCHLAVGQVLHRLPCSLSDRNVAASLRQHTFQEQSKCRTPLQGA